MTNREAAIQIIKRLHRNGYQSLLAGGCVRDMLLGRRPKDYDIATDAQPKDVMKIFKRTLKVGAKFGVVIVLIDNQQVEVATFRMETGYTDGRHPTKVKFSTPAKDASRRDFTINGMFYDPLKKKVIDYVNGQADLEKKMIRTIGSAIERFSEDYLRMLRAIRFSTQLGFSIEPATFSAIRSDAKNIMKISGERIAIELEAILTSPNRSDGALLLAESGLTEALFSSLTNEQIKAGIKVLGKLRKKTDFALALAAFFVGCENQFAVQKSLLLKLSRSRYRHIKFLLVSRGKLLDEKMSLAELKKLLAEPYFGDLYELQKAINKAGFGPGRGVTILNKLRKRIKALGDIELKPKPLLNGYDLIRLGAGPGPALGQLAEEMYIAQLEMKLKTPKQAEHWVKIWLQKHKMTE